MRLIVTQIVDGIELGTEDFIALVEMVQVAAAEVLTGITVALGI